MIRLRALWLMIALLILLSLACNAVGGNVEPVAPAPTTAVADSLDTTTATPAFAATATLSSLGDEATLTVLVDLNIRSGPGVQYNRLGFLEKDVTAVIVGQDPISQWWQIDCPPDIDGSSCWVSGGAQYTRAQNASDVPAAEVPPTPTPHPPQLQANEGVITYIDNGRLYAARLALDQNPPQMGQPELLVNVSNVQRLLLAPDGKRVAYIAGTSQENSLNIVNIDGQDERTLITSVELAENIAENSVELGEDSVEISLFIDQVQWLADSLNLAFNTTTVNNSGPGVASREDLWTVSLDGDLSARLPAGEGGGAFVVLPDGQVVLSRSDELLRSNLDGSAADIVVTYETINTASEYVYYPQPQLTIENISYVTVPDSEPWADDAGATLWQIPLSGPAVRLGRLSGNILFNPVSWTADGSRLAYVQRLNDPANPPPQLVLANGDGATAVPFGPNMLVTFREWHVDNNTFLYSGDGFIAVGVPDGPAEIVEIGTRQTADAQWVNETAYIVATGFAESSSWQLSSVSITGTAVALTTINSGPNVQFAVWAND